MKNKQIVILFAFGIALSAPVLGHKGYRTDGQHGTQQTMTTQNKNTGSVNLFEPAGESGDWKPADPLNGIDALTFKKMREDGVPINGLCDDSTFLRRTALLLTGRLPDPEETRRFLKDTDPNKRSAYIDSVLASEAFNTHWAFWFQEYFGSTGQLLRAGLPLFNEYFDEAVRSRKPLDVMARELLTTTGLSDEVPEANFFVRANEGARLVQDFWDNLAAYAGERFLGVSLGCISCHDGAYHLEDINLFLAEKKREDFWAMAAFFSGVNRRPGTRQENLILSVNVIERPTRGYSAESNTGDRPIRDGGLVQPRFILTGSEAAPDENYLAAAAQMITGDRQFARNFANRFWGHLFGLAMVEPMNGFDPYRIDPDRVLPEGWTRQALDLDLLEHMTDQLIAFKLDLRDYLRYVLNSATFQMSSEFKPGNWQETYAPYYTRFLARRLPAETIYDSLVAATGVAVPMFQRSRYSDGQIESVDYAHQLSDTNQPRGRQQEPIFTFLEAFGRGNRYDTPRTDRGDIGQALMLMNSSVIQSRLLARENRLFDYLNSDQGAEAIIDELYLDFFCREATGEETNALLTEIAKYETPAEQVSTIQWLLINKLEFTYIY